LSFQVLNHVVMQSIREGIEGQRLVGVEISLINVQARQSGLAVKCPRIGLPQVSSAIESPDLAVSVDTMATVPHRHRGGSMWAGDAVDSAERPHETRISIP